MNRVLISLLFVFVLTSSQVNAEEQWWKKWPSHPDVPRITAKEVKALIMAGEKVLLVYAGYKIEKVICGSIVIPYTLVPPNSDGSRVKLRIPKDYWIMCY